MGYGKQSKCTDVVSSTYIAISIVRYREKGVLEWAMSLSGDDKNYCKYCKLNIHVHQSDLVSHAKTKTKKCDIKESQRL